MVKRVLMFVCALLVTFQTVHADLYCDDFEDGSLDGWTQKIGSWSVGEEDGNHYLKCTNSVYGVIWKDGSEGVNQRVQVDAYFDPSDTSHDKINKIAHLRLRTGQNSGGTQAFWDTGYLAEIRPEYVSIQNLYEYGNPIIAKCEFATSPITSAGWYTLMFEVTGQGSDTCFNVSVDGSSYITDYYYTNTVAALDSGYIGLGRLIKYDNVCCATDVVATPTPTAAILGLLGLSTAAAKLRRRRNLTR